MTVEVLTSLDGSSAFTLVAETDYTVLPPVSPPGLDNIEMVTIRIKEPTLTGDTLRFFRLQFTAPEDPL